LPQTPSNGPEHFDTAADAALSSVSTVSSAPSAPPLMQQPALGTPEMPTVGSSGHAFGECKPCAFFHKQCCQNGVQCKFCHLCGPEEKRRRHKEKKTQFKQMANEKQLQEQLAKDVSLGSIQVATTLSRAAVNSQNEARSTHMSIPAQEVESRPCPTMESGRSRRSKPCALDLDDDVDVTMSLATPQPLPATPSECWPPTPAENASGVDVASVHLGSWELAPTMFPTTLMPLPMEEASWLWQPLMPPPAPISPGEGVWSSSDVQPLSSIMPPRCDRDEIELVPASSRVLLLADTIQEPRLGTEEFPTVGSVHHRFGTCKPCSFLHKRGCGNGVNCQFCHLCDAGEKKRRQKAKKMQLQMMMRETETRVPLDAAGDDASASCRAP